MTTPRRWFRFSLRTMLVVVTLVGCWLGYQLNWIRERQRLIAGASSGTGVEIMRFHAFSRGFTGLSAWRRWLGDQPQAQVVTAFPPSDPRWARLRTLFPESALMCVTMPETPIDYSADKT